MKLVRFTRDMRPYHKGDERAMPDEMAEKIVAVGDGLIVPSVFDRPVPTATARPRYRTKKKVA